MLANGRVAGKPAMFASKLAPTGTLKVQSRWTDDLHALLSSLSTLGPILGGKIPIQQLVDHRVNIIGATILIVQIIGMLPHVDGE